DGEAVALPAWLRQDRGAGRGPRAFAGNNGAAPGAAPGPVGGIKVGSVNRPAAAVGIVFEEDFDVGAVEFVGGENEFVVDLEEDDWGHEGRGEVPGGLLGEGKIVRHLRAPSWSGPIPARWLRQCAAAVAITAQASAKRPQ